MVLVKIFVIFQIYICKISNIFRLACCIISAQILYSRALTNVGYILHDVKGRALSVIFRPLNHYPVK